jgi:glutamyl-tRNA(Gln) amidotransferase subunit E
VEDDEESPHFVNSKASDICPTRVLFFDAEPVDEIQFMRKIVFGGTNNSGFQRTTRGSDDEGALRKS